MSESETGMGETAAERGFPPAMSNTSSGGANDAVRAPQRQETTPDDLAALDHAYQTHCTDCYMGTLEWCEGGLAPNGQRCATTDTERIVYLLDVLRRVVAQRDAADVETRALTARLAAVEKQAEVAFIGYLDKEYASHCIPCLKGICEICIEARGTAGDGQPCRCQHAGWYAEGLRRAAKALQAIAGYPCISDLLGEGDPDDGCGCAACVAKAVLPAAVVTLMTREDEPTDGR